VKAVGGAHVRSKIGITSRTSDGIRSVILPLLALLILLVFPAFRAKLFLLGSDTIRQHCIPTQYIHRIRIVLRPVSLGE